MRHQRCARFLLRLAVVATVLGVLAWAVFEAAVTQAGWQAEQQIGDPDRYRPPMSALVYDRNGALIDSFAAERRIWVPIDELPPHVWQAFIAAEDRKFFDHHGIDPTAILRAFYVNLKAGHIAEGGSTITQQLAKNLVVGGEKSYVRKLKEALVAHWLERSLSKREILELYLNYVYLGSGSFGIEAAAQQYFRKSARELDAGQAAMIAGVIPAPSRYNPDADPQFAREVRSQVLTAMVEMRFVTKEQAADFRDDPVRVPVEPPAQLPSRVGDAYRTQVRRELRRLLGADRAFREGLKVFTPYDPRIQEVAEQAVRDAVVELQSRQGLRGPEFALPREGWEGWLAEAPELPRDVDDRLLPPEPGACFPALVHAGVSDLRAGPFRFTLRRNQLGLRVRSERPGDVGPGPLSSRVRTGHVIRVCTTGPVDEGSVHEVLYDLTPFAEAAAVVMENATGNIVALVGGKRDVLEDFVRATQARRQPGSTFKLFVYATALSEGASQTDIVHDSPISLPGANGRVWSPKNYGGDYRGAMPLRQALALSRNLPSVRLTLKVGPEAVVRMARSLGVTSPLRPDPTIALGSSELTPMEQTIAFATIARMGSRPEPVYLLDVFDQEGRLMGSAGGDLVLNDDSRIRLPGGPGEVVIDPGVAYELSDMLRAVVEAGTGRRALRPDHVRIGKTGTTNSATDTWFVGSTPDHTIAVWVGSDRPDTLGDRETGGRAALPSWITIADALPPPSRPDFPVPPEAVRLPHQGGWMGFARKHVPDRQLPRPAVGDAPLPVFPAPRPEGAGHRLAATGED